MHNTAVKQDGSESGTFQKEPIACPLCSSDEFNVTYSPTAPVTDPIKLYGAASGVRNTQTLVTCKDCGLLYENPRFSEATIIQGYSSATDAGHDSQHAMRVRSFLNALNGLKRYIPAPGAKLLDVGTAGGAFLEAATTYGFDAYGIEPSKYLTEKGQKRGLKISQGTIEHATYPANSFDIICLWDVLEHVVDPKSVLTHIKRLLKPDGVLLINYPDIGTWQAKLAGSKFWWLLSVHLTHFSPKTIRFIAEKTGYKVEKLIPYWQTLEFGYLIGIARHLGVPTAGFFEKVIPNFIKRIPVPYYASQTTAILRPKI